MAPVQTIFFIVVLIFAALTLAAELRRDLMMMQQNSYRIDRYRRWLKASGDTTSMWRLAAMCVFLASLVAFTRAEWSMTLIGIYSSCAYIWLASIKYKKPLVWTNRARRIYIVDIAIVISVCTIVCVLDASNAAERLFVASAVLIGLLCASHIVTMASIVILQPIEKSINRKYFNDAQRILNSMPGLKVIGITGSYGKTSTKHYLHRILSESFEVLMTPGSYNTTLGVVRTIREMMQPYTEVFICEMGAKQPGDIKEICDLVQPTIGIITAVGPQHLESFKTVERVRDTKFELIDSLPSDGFAVVNNDFAPAAGREVDNVECVRYAITNVDSHSYRAVDIKYSSLGTTFCIVCPDGELLPLRTRLVGECNISNLLAAVIVALHLGVPKPKIRQAVERIEQVEHRLNIKRIPDGLTIIDDAFNSNPTGSKMALDVLKSMTEGKRIVITPGMIELGDKQDELNREFGVAIAQSVDIAIIVGEYNRAAITEGIENAGCQPPQVYTVDKFTDAQQLLTTISSPGDTVLYENDLPDTFK